MRVLPLADRGVEGAEPQVAMRLEWAQAQLLSQGEGLAVMGFGGLDLWGITMRGNLAEEPAGMCLIATSCVGTGEIEEAPGQCTRLVHAANEEQGLAQLGEYEGMEEQEPPSGHALQHLVDEWEGLRRAPGKGIRRTQDGGSQGSPHRDVGSLVYLHAPFKHGNRGVERSLAAVDQTSIPKCSGNTEGLLDRFGQPHRCFCYARPAGKV